MSAFSGCSGERIPFVHRIDIPQGNIVTQEMVSQLERGMEKQRVRYIMGTPLLVDVFHQDRWDYVFRIRKANREVEERRITLFFQDDRLVGTSGDVLSHAVTQEGTTSGATSVEVPLRQDKGFLGGVMESIGLGDEETESEDKSQPSEKGQ